MNTNTTCMFCATTRPATFLHGSIDGLNPIYAAAGSIGLAVAIILAAAIIFTRSQTKALRAEQSSLAATRRATRAIQAQGMGR